MKEIVGESLAKRLVEWEVVEAVHRPRPGAGTVPDDHPLTTGGLGLLGTRPSEELTEVASSAARSSSRGRCGSCRSTDFWARGCGAYGVKVTKPGDVRSALRDALAHPGPALVDVDVNPDEPPMPGKIEYAQAKHFAQAALRGQPHLGATAATIATDKINELFRR